MMVPVDPALLFRSTLDGLAPQLAVVNHAGEIVFTNKAYRDFAQENGGDAALVSERVNYLAICDAAQGHDAEYAWAFARGLREVIAGTRAVFEMEYPCDSPDVKRWFLARVSVLPNDASGLVVVWHENITERKRSDDLLQRQMQRSHALLRLPRLADELDEVTFMRRGMELAETLTASTTSFIHFVSEAKGPIQQGIAEGAEALHRVITVPVTEKGLVVMLAGVGNKDSAYTTFDTESVQLIATAIWQFVRNARSTREARDAATRLERLSEHLPGALYQFQIRPDGTTCLPYASMGILDVYGVLPDQVIGDASGAFGAMHPDDRAEVDASIQESARSLTVWRNQHRVIFPDGRIIWVEGEATPEAQSDGSYLWHGYIRDITERVETDAKLRKLTRAVEQSDATIVITDRDGRIEYANPHFEKSSGYTVAEALGQNPRMMQGGDTPRETYTALWTTLLAGNEWRGELKNRRKDGTSYWESVTISPVRDANGVIANFVAVKADITANKQLVEERAKLQTQLNHAQKMESVGRLAGGVAHDFNNLLTVINGTVELALASPAPAETYREDLVAIQEAAQRATALTRQLLTFSRRGVVQARSVPINEIVTPMLSMLRRIVGEDVAIDTDLADDAGIVLVDAGQLEQVITNLCVNARDAMPRGGRITVSTTHLMTPQGSGSLGASADSVRLTVRDTGTGMSDDVQDRLFEPFFTTKAVGKGTGLGLAIVYGIVTQSGGTVTVDSTVGVGTAIHIQLPRRDEPDSVPSAKVRTGLVRGSGVILVVDDEPALGGITQRILQHAGYTVLLAHSGADAIRQARALNGKLDLLISDVIMPEMYGPEVAATLRAHDAGIRVMFVSGHSGDILKNSGLAEDDYAFLAKPFSIPELTTKVQEVLAA